MKYDLNKLLEEDLIQGIPKNKEKAQLSMKTSEKWLGEAEKNLENETYRSCILSSYLAMFHSARSILYADGYREKSHFAVARYLESQYVNKDKLQEKWTDLLDHTREKRHGDQYGVSFTATEKEAEKALNSAKKFTEKMKELLENK